MPEFEFCLYFHVVETKSPCYEFTHQLLSWECEENYRKIKRDTFAERFQSLIGPERNPLSDVNTKRPSPVCVSAAELTAAPIVFWFCFASHVRLS